MIRKERTTHTRNACSRTEHLKESQWFMSAAWDIFLYIGCLQNVYDPAMTPFAVAGGKTVWASRVIGNDKMKKRVGGITSRSLIGMVSLIFSVES